MDKQRVLKNLNAAGATEGGRQGVEDGFRMFEDFCAGRKLRVVRGSFSPVSARYGRTGNVAWIHGKRYGTKKYVELEAPEPPFVDHERLFVDRDTGRRVFTIQPYITDIVEKVDVPKEFVSYLRRMLTVRPGKPFLESDRELLSKIVDFARVSANDYAFNRGLQAKVTLNGWYNPYKVLLIEYTKATPVQDFEAEAA